MADPSLLTSNLGFKIKGSVERKAQLSGHGTQCFLCGCSAFGFRRTGDGNKVYLPKVSLSLSATERYKELEPGGPLVGPNYRLW